MVSDFDPYLILQVDPSAQPEDIESAYERLMREYDSTSGERLREMRAAYALLRDPEQRRAYDVRRTERMAAAVAEAERAPGAGVPPLPARPPVRLPWGPMDVLKAVGVIVLGTLVFGGILGLIALMVAGDQAIEDHPQALAIALGANILLQVLLLGATVWFTIRKYGGKWRDLGVQRPARGGVWLAIGLFGGAMLLQFVYGIVLDIAGISPDTDLPGQVFDHFLPFLVVLALTLVFAPVIEEIFFRGFVFGALRQRWGAVAAALASGVLFGLAHAGNPGYLPVLPAVVLIGALFAWGYYFSGSILPSMGAHFLFNSLSLAVSVASS